MIYSVKYIHIRLEYSTERQSSEGFGVSGVALEFEDVEDLLLYVQKMVEDQKEYQSEVKPE